MGDIEYCGLETSVLLRDELLRLDRQHQGIVEALRQIGTDHVKADGSRGPLSALVAQRVAREALDRLGGQ